MHVDIAERRDTGGAVLELPADGTPSRPHSCAQGPLEARGQGCSLQRRLHRGAPTLPTPLAAPFSLVRARIATPPLVVRPRR